MDEILGRLSVDRAAACDLLARDVKDGLPIGASLFYRKPLIRADATMLIAASPWTVRAHLHHGLWALHLQAAKAVLGKSGPTTWFTAFGDMFEMWCRNVAERAYRAPGAARDNLLLSASIGSSDEIADVVVQAGRDIVLFSMKSRFLNELAVKRAGSPARVLEWYEETLFAHETISQDGQKHRHGAVRALDVTAKAIAAGKYPALDPRSQVHPVIVTYDDVGGDTFGANSWLQLRCRQEGLLQGPRESVLTMIDIRDFERLMGLASHGVSVPKLLAEKTSAKWRLETLEVLLADRRVTLEDARLRYLDERFEELTRAMAQELGFERADGTPPI